MRTGFTDRSDGTVSPGGPYRPHGTRRALRTSGTHRPRRTLQAAVSDRGTHLLDFGKQLRHGPRTRLLGARNLILGARKRPRHQKSRLIPRQRRIAIETPIRKTIHDAKRRNLSNGTRSPMVTRYVTEPGRHRRRRCTASPIGHPIEKSIDQHGRLIPGQRLRGKERTVREPRLEPSIGQLLHRAAAPIGGGILALDGYERHADGQDQGPDGELADGRTFEWSHTGTTSRPA